MTLVGSPRESASYQVLDHAWRWFELHARQRLQPVNFFILSSAFLTSAYAVALDSDRPDVAAVIATVGVLVAIYFDMIEARVRKLFKVGEEAMAQSEHQLAEAAEITEVRLVFFAEKSGWRFTKYSKVILFLQFTFLAAFALAAVYAVAEMVD